MEKFVWAVFSGRFLVGILYVAVFGGRFLVMAVLYGRFLVGGSW